MRNDGSSGRLFLWLAMLCFFLFWGIVFLLKPEYRERAGAAFPLFSQLASKMDAAAEQLKQGNVCQVFVEWGDDCAETNSDS